MPSEVKTYLSTGGKQVVYSGDEIQERDSVLCGYWCLYYLCERQMGRSILKTIHNAKLNMNDQSVNHRFIISYFKKQQGAGNPALDAAKYAEKAVRKFIPSTNHVFDRYWSGEMVKNCFHRTYRYNN